MDKLPQIIQSSSISSKSPPTLDLLEKWSCTLYQRDQLKLPKLLADILAYSGTALFDLGLDIDPRDNNRLLGVRLGGFGFKVPSRIIITTFLLQTHSQCHRPHYYHHHPLPQHQLNHDLHPHHDDLPQVLPAFFLTKSAFLWGKL